MANHEKNPRRGPVRDEAPHEHEPLGPLWVITIGMGAFFLITALVTALG